MPFEDKNAKYTVINSDPDGEIIKMIDSLTEPLLTQTDESMVNAFFRIKGGALQLNDNALKHPTMKRLLDDPQTTFDLVLVCPFLAGEAGYLLAQKWKSPTAIYFTAQAQMPFVNHAIGQPFNPSYMSLTMLPFENGNMNLVQRVINTFACFMFEHVFRNIIILRDVNGLLDQHFPGESRPDLLDLERNVSAVFSFSHPMILDGWSPQMPNFVPLGMMNCRPGKAFAKGDPIGDYLAASKNGVVYVSFGSVLKASLMTPKHKSMLMKAFARFPQYDFLWKWEQDEMEGKPDNVMLSKWLPQQDILAHPKMKVFVTHAGQSSFQESLCHQKPVVAIPVSGDQPINAKEAAKMGFGIALPYNTLTEQDLYHALDRVLHDPQYLEKAQQLGSVLNDQITRPLDRAIWWIEHLIKHPFMYQGKSAVHKLYWFQYFLLDVLAIYLAISWVIFKVLKFIFCKLFWRQSSAKVKTE